MPPVVLAYNGTMLVRLRVKGFKNLADVDVRFGPFTCVAGPNGAGKSNLFDAIRFLSLLASGTMVDAARQIRDPLRRGYDVRSIFTRAGTYSADRIEFIATVLLPKSFIDEFGQPREATSTLLEYSVTIGKRDDGDPSGALELLDEAVKGISVGEASKEIGFPHSKEWLTSVVTHRRRARTGYLYVDKGFIYRSQDTQAGKATPVKMSATPRTVISQASPLEAPTLAALKGELQSWRFLMLDPSALREPDELHAPSHLTDTGGHLASTVRRLATQNGHDRDILQELTNALSRIYPPVREIAIDTDDKRSLLTLTIRDHDGNLFPAKSLSDGTLRYLALAILELDDQAGGVFCLEEPENGVHPSKVSHVVQLLRDLATDAKLPGDADNPLRQVIVNTHSPLVVNAVDADEEIILTRAELQEFDGHPMVVAMYRALRGSWRQKLGAHSILPSQAEAYVEGTYGSGDADADSQAPKRKRLRDWQLVLIES
jgi:predicted ATPase